MERITVTMQRLPQETRLCLMAGRDEVKQVILGPMMASRRRTTATLQEGLSLWHQRALSFVLCAYASGSSSATRMLHELGFGVQTVPDYEAHVAFPAHPGRNRRSQGFGNFSDLRPLGLDAVAS